MSDEEIYFLPFQVEERAEPGVTKVFESPENMVEIQEEKRENNPGVEKK